MKFTIHQISTFPTITHNNITHLHIYFVNNVFFRVYLLYSLLFYLSMIEKNVHCIWIHSYSQQSPVDVFMILNIFMLFIVRTSIYLYCYVDKILDCRVCIYNIVSESIQMSNHINFLLDFHLSIVFKKSLELSEEISGQIFKNVYYFKRLR